MLERCLVSASEVLPHASSASKLLPAGACLVALLLLAQSTPTMALLSARGKHACQQHACARAKASAHGGGARRTRHEPTTCARALEECVMQCNAFYLQTHAQPY